MNHQLARIYTAGAQHDVIMSDNGRTRKWTGQQPERRRRGRGVRSVEEEEEAAEAEDTWTFLMRRGTLAARVLSHTTACRGCRQMLGEQLRPPSFRLFIYTVSTLYTVTFYLTQFCVLHYYIFAHRTVGHPHRCNRDPSHLNRRRLFAPWLQKTRLSEIQSVSIKHPNMQHLIHWQGAENTTWSSCSNWQKCTTTTCTSMQ